MARRRRFRRGLPGHQGGGLDECVANPRHIAVGGAGSCQRFQILTNESSRRCSKANFLRSVMMVAAIGWSKRRAGSLVSTVSVPVWPRASVAASFHLHRFAGPDMRREVVIGDMLDLAGAPRGDGEFKLNGSLGGDGFLSVPADHRLQRPDPVVVTGRDVELQRAAARFQMAGGRTGPPAVSSGLTSNTQWARISDPWRIVTGAAIVDRHLERGVGGIQLDKGELGPGSPSLLRILPIRRARGPGAHCRPAPLQRRRRRRRGRLRAVWTARRCSPVAPPRRSVFRARRWVWRSSVGTRRPRAPLSRCRRRRSQQREGLPGPSAGPADHRAQTAAGDHGAGAVGLG